MRALINRGGLKKTSGSAQQIPSEAVGEAPPTAQPVPVWPGSEGHCAQQLIYA